jgi:cell division protein FtsI (penicillin-binding protein 3)
MKLSLRPVRNVVVAVARFGARALTGFIGRTAPEAPAPTDPLAPRGLAGALRNLFRTRLDKSGGRARMLALVFFAAYVGIGGKLVFLGLRHDPPQTLKVAADEAASGARPDLLDRNGAILATDVKTM